MRQKIVSYETGVLAKEKGFEFKYNEDWEYDKYENPNNYFFKLRRSEHIVTVSAYYADTAANMQQYIDLDVAAPTQTELQDWLREKQIDITVLTEWKNNGKRKYKVGFSYVKNNLIEIWFSRDEDNIPIEYDSYEEALEVGIVEALKLI